MLHGTIANLTHNSHYYVNLSRQRLTIEQLIERLADQDDQLIAHTEAETRLSEQLARLRTAIAEITARLDKLAVDRPRAAAQASALHQMDLNERAEITKLCTM